jgi:hypothetical protein
MGWGGFNIVEGTANHFILGIHRVRDDLGAARLGPRVPDLGRDLSRRRLGPGAAGLAA